jgi:putative endonuclease
MIKNDFEKLYVGITENPKNRLYYHNSKMGAKFTKGKAKFRIVFLEEQENLAEARKREIQIKKWRRDKKEKLIYLYNKGINTKQYVIRKAKLVVA